MEGWVYIGATLLVAAGFAKVRDTAPTGGALAAARLPSPALVVIGLGSAEIVAGLAVIGFGGFAAAIAQAGLYAGFGGFVAVVKARDLPLQSCGCFGRADTPPSPLHIVINAALALGAVWFAAIDGPSLIDTLAHQPLAGVPYVGLVAIGGYAVYLLLTELPRLQQLASAAR